MMVRIIKIQLSHFIPKKGFIKAAGFKIPSATSMMVTKDRKMSTPQIFCWLDLKVRSPLKIDNLCAAAILYQIKECKYKYPNQVNKVPVKTYFFDHFIVPSSFVCANDHIEKNNQIDKHARKYVESVKASDKKEEIGKQSISIFISDKVGALYHIYSLI